MLYHFEGEWRISSRDSRKANIKKTCFISNQKFYYHASVPSYNAWGHFSDESNDQYYPLSFLSENGEKFDRKDPNFYFPTNPHFL